MTIGSAGLARLATAGRYRNLAQCIADDAARAALIATAAEFEASTGPYADELQFLNRRYDEEMASAANAHSSAAKVAHLELALRYAVRARDLRGQPGLLL